MWNMQEFGIQYELTITGQSRSTTSRRKELCTWNCVCVVKLSWRTNHPAERWDVRHQWQRENQDQHKAHETRQWRDTHGEHVNVRVVLVFLVLVLFLLLHSCLAHIAWLKMFACWCHLIQAWGERSFLPPWSLRHLHLPSLIPHQPQAVSATLQLPRG